MPIDIESRALGALVVQSLRATQDDEVDIEHLPKLSEKERLALDSLGPDFIEKLLARDTP